MSKKNKLPESLELLLDTMCNTFGAIMFIAISLVIISQVTTKMIRDMQPQEVTEEYLEQMRQRIRALETAVIEEEQKAAEKALAALAMPKEKREKIEKLQAARAENQRLILAISHQVDEKTRMQNELEKTRNEVENTRNEAAQVEVETTQKERALAQMILANQQRKEEMQRRIEQAQKEQANLKKTLENTSPQTLTFSMQVSTSGERQYAICLKNRRLYRVDSGEVEAIRDNEHYGHFSFNGSGHSISENAEGEVRRLLGGVSQGRFVTIWADQASYDVLVILRKYFRSRKIKVNFFYTDDWQCGFGSDNKASY